MTKSEKRFTGTCSEKEFEIFELIRDIVGIPKTEFFRVLTIQGIAELLYHTKAKSHQTISDFWNAVIMTRLRDWANFNNLGDYIINLKELKGGQNE